MPALDGLADHRRSDLVGDLDVPQFGLSLRHEVGEQLRDDRHIADLVAAQAEAARDVFERGRDRLLATGRYVSVVPDSVLHFAGDRLSFRPLPVKLPVHPRPVAVVTLRHRTLSPVAQLFIDCARKLTKSLGRASR